MKNPKKIFLIDGVGALVSLLLLGCVLPFFQTYIGMPLDTLYLLTFFAVFFCFYSFNCYLREIPNPITCLKLIIFGNSLYGVITAALVVRHFSKLTSLGLIYFLCDVTVIFGVVAYEWRYLLRWNAFPKQKSL